MTSADIAHEASIEAQRGNWQRALDLYKTARDLSPLDPRHWDDYLYFLHHAPISSEEHFAEHLKYGALFPEASPVPRIPKSNGKIRIGYLSSDLHEHATAFILEPILEAHDREHFEIYLYYTGTTPDFFTAKLASHAVVFRHLAGNAPEIRARIIDDAIDILIDLGGHTGGNNLPVFALRAAPVQVSWFSYMNTSGLAQMDYRITDEWRIPSGREKFYTEKLIYLPNSYTFRPLPEALPPPTSGKKYAFGSFNTLHKITIEMLDTWAKILKHKESSRLIVMTPRGPEHGVWVKKQFENRAINPARIEPREYTLLPELLKLMNETGVALGTYPYTGGATTYHTLSVGVPTVILEGETEYQRNSAAIMREVGLDDWIVRSYDEYVQKALEEPKHVKVQLGAHTTELVRTLEQKLYAILQLSI